MDEPLVDAAVVLKDHFENHARLSVMGLSGTESDEQLSVFSAFHIQNMENCAPVVVVNSGMGSCRSSLDLCPATARQLASALLAAADVVEPMFVQWTFERAAKVSSLEQPPCSSQ